MIFPLLVRSSAVLALILLGAPQSRAAAVDPGGDLEHIRPLLEQTLETEKSGIEIRWSNPDTGHNGKIRVERTFFRNERPCRDYLRTVSRPSRSGFVIRGTACRTGRAVWSIEDENAVETDAPKKRVARPSAPTSPRLEDRREPPPRPEPSGESARAEPERKTPAAAPGEAGPAASEPARESESEPFVSFTRPSRSPI